MSQFFVDHPIVFFIALFVALRGYEVLSRKQDHLRHQVRRLGGLIFGFAAGMLILPQFVASNSLFVGSVIASLVGVVLVGERKASRHIAKGTKRKVIERDLPKGEKYDSSKWHFDHEVPFSRGGDTSVRNLRLRPKRENLKKGAKMPGFGDFR